ncbi:MAG: adenylosuccinate synthetase, partial [Gammaproteobacteria bacterium]
IKIAVAYERDGEQITIMPCGADEFESVNPVYIEMPGWSESTVGAKDVADLPQNAKDFIAKIEKIVSAPVDIISTGPERNETIILRHPFA